jgi:hypothetical protein
MHSSSRGGNGWPPPKREWWGYHGFVRTNVTSRLVMAVSLLGENGGGPYLWYGRIEVLALRHSNIGEAFS